MKYKWTDRDRVEAHYIGSQASMRHANREARPLEFGVSFGS